MVRMARVVVPGIAHHLTQRGNRRQRVFFRDEDYAEYLALLRQWCPAYGVTIWGYCLMPNHVHLIAVPASPAALRGAIGEVHRRYSRRINFRKNWRGHLWQGRFASYPMDEPYLLLAARYIELNPVRAKMVLRAEDYPWSSAAAHVHNRPDPLLGPCPIFQEGVADWRRFLAEAVDEPTRCLLQRHERTGRPLGDEAFLSRIERRLHRTLRKLKPGPKPRQSKRN